MEPTGKTVDLSRTRADAGVIPGIIYGVSATSSHRHGEDIQPALALKALDGDGEAEFALITKQPPPGKEPSVQLQPDDFDGAAVHSGCYVRFEKRYHIDSRNIIRPEARLTDKAMASVFRSIIAAETSRFHAHAHRRSEFVPGKSPVQVSGRTFDHVELRTLVDSALDFWLTTGRFNDAFERRLEEFLGVKHVLTTNSGSSANLLAVAALTSPKLGEKRLKPGDEVITVAAAFPTTVNPLLQYGLTPVFVDVDIPTYGIRPDHIEPAVTERTRAIVLAHTLGNAFDLGEALRVAQKFDLWVIEDCCDALGTRYDPGDSESPPRPVGTFGHIGTFSFYPAHHITMGEGGALATNDGLLRKVIESFRDWGRDCWCPPGHDNTCKRRFEWRLGELPAGYDHKYVYSHVGYNLKITDMQAAVGLAQMEKLERFMQRRARNFELLEAGLKPFEDLFILPKATPGCTPSWFGFPITLTDGAPFKREDLLRFLNDKNIGTRLLFGGNLLRQPYFKGLPYKVFDGRGFSRDAALLCNTDRIMTDTFWTGVFPALTDAHIQYIVDTIAAFVAKNTSE